MRVVLEQRPASLNRPGKRALGNIPADNLCLSLPFRRHENTAIATTVAMAAITTSSTLTSS